MVDYSGGFSPYLPDNAAEQLRKYVYHGADYSPIYRNFWKPLCSRLVYKLPRWLAPNVITVSALILVIITHCWIALYMPALQPRGEGYPSCPPHVLLCAGLALFLYQLLDNLDGHQARRLGVSSSLGLLMDHGCDAFNCIVASLSIASAIACGPTWRLWVCFMSTVIGFFMNTWEEYYRGALILPAFNGPNEGIVIAIAAYWFTAFHPEGSNWWRRGLTIPHTALPQFLQHDAVMYFHGFDQPVENPSKARAFVKSFYSEQGDFILQYNTIAVLTLATCTLFTTIGNLYQVYTAVNSVREIKYGQYGSGWLHQKHPFLHSLTRLLPLCVVSVLANVWYFVSPNDIFAQHPRAFCWTVGLLYTKLAIHLMIAHLCCMEYHPFRRTLVPFFFLAVHLVIDYLISKGRGAKAGDIVQSEEIVLFEFFALSAVTFGHLVLNSVKEMSTALNVFVFVVPAEKQAVKTD